jgi:GNAT superfamily N-acetyltransferase
MRSEDAPAVADLTGTLGYPSTAAEIAGRFEAISRRRDGLIFVAEATGGPVVGWVHIRPARSLESDPFAEIAGLVVAEGARGQGIGRVLVGAAEGWAREHGYEIVRVRSSIARVGAHAFYEHLGYCHVKTQKNFRKMIGRPDC